MVQSDGCGLGLALRTVVDGIRVIARPVLGLHEAQLRVSVPLGCEVESPAYIGRVAVVGACFLAGVSPCLSIVDVSVDDAGFAKVKALACRVVLESWIDFGLHLPGRDTHLGVNHDEAAGQIAVLGRGDTPYDLHLVDVVGRYLSKVCAREGST